MFPEALGLLTRLDPDDRVAADRSLEALRRVERQDPAVVHDRDPLTELVGFLHVVRGQHDRLALAVDLTEDLPQGEPRLGVEPGRRFVQEQDIGAVGHGSGE